MNKYELDNCAVLQGKIQAVLGGDRRKQQAQILRKVDNETLTCLLKKVDIDTLYDGRGAGVDLNDVNLITIGYTHTQRRQGQRC